MKKNIYTLLVASALFITGCDTETDSVGLGNYPIDGKVRISTALQTSQTVQTKAGSATYTGSNLSLSLDYGVGTPFTVTNILWSTSDGGTSWSPESQMLWKDATTVAKVYAYAPIVAGVTAIESVPFTVVSDQSTGLIPSDLLVYTDEAFIPGSSLTAKQAINITFKHVLSKLVVNLKYGDQWGDTPPAIAEVTINGTKPTTSLNVKTQAIASARGGSTDIIACAAATTAGAAATYEAILVPQTSALGTKLVSITLATGEVYSYTITSSSGITFESGKQHAITLRVGKDAVELGGIQVADWDATIDLGSDDSELIRISDPNFIAALKEAPYNIPTVTVAGKEIIDISDAATRSAIEAIEVLDVSSKNIKSLEGIEYFKNLKKLYCYGNQLTQLELRNLSKLQTLYCPNSRLTQLSLSGLTALQSLYCYNNELTQLDLISLAHLQILDCADNPLTQLDVSVLTHLLKLDCSSSQLTQLDVSGLTDLQELLCGSQEDAEHNPQNLNLSLTQPQSEWFSATNPINANVTQVIVSVP